MFAKPEEKNYLDYSSYALAAVGYALLVQAPAGVVRAAVVSSLGGCDCGGGGVVDAGGVVGLLRAGTSVGSAGGGGGCGGGSDGVGSLGAGGTLGGHGGGGDGPDVSLGRGAVRGSQGSSGRGETFVGAQGVGGFPEEPVGSVGSPGGRSANWRRKEKNRNRRMRRREARAAEACGAKAQGRVPEWRVGAGPILDGSSGAGAAGAARGYFSDLSVEMQRQLKQTRAELLVAENRRKLAMEKSKLEQLQSPVAALERAMRALGFAERAAKKAGNSKVASWANEVVTSYAETVAKTVASEEGSYESFVWSAGTQSTPQSVIASEREQEYNRKVAALKDAYELMDVYFPEDLEQKLETLREEHGDVLYPGQQGLDVKACHDLIQMVDNSEWDLSVKVKLIELAEKKMEEAKKGFFDY